MHGLKGKYFIVSWQFETLTRSLYHAKSLKDASMITARALLVMQIAGLVLCIKLDIIDIAWLT